MIKYVKGDLFDSNAQTLVNTVNTAGVMGKGVALAFKNRFPDMYKDYREKCERGQLKMGVLDLYTETEPWVLNFPTKFHWRSKSKLDDIQSGLIYLVEHYREWGIQSLAMPALGCGHGGLNWEDVRTLIDEYLRDTDMDIEVYEPGSEASLTSEDGMLDSEQPYYTQDLFGDPVEFPKKKKKRK